MGAPEVIADGVQDLIDTIDRSYRKALRLRDERDEERGGFREQLAEERRRAYERGRRSGAKAAEERAARRIAALKDECERLRAECARLRLKAKELYEMGLEDGAKAARDGGD